MRFDWILQGLRVDAEGRRLTLDLGPICRRMGLPMIDPPAIKSIMDWWWPKIRLNQYR